MPGLEGRWEVKAGLVAATGLLTATVQVGVVGLLLGPGPGGRGEMSGMLFPRPAYCITLGVGEVGSCSEIGCDMRDVVTVGECADNRAEDRRDVLDVMRVGVLGERNGTLMGSGGGDIEQVVGGNGVDIERREGGRGLRLGRTEKD